jgi:hypothetical protein
VDSSPADDSDILLSSFLQIEGDDPSDEEEDEDDEI